MYEIEIVPGVVIRTRVLDIAEDLDELARALRGEEYDFKRAFRGLEYLRRWKYRNPVVYRVIVEAERKLLGDIKSGRVDVWT